MGLEGMVAKRSSSVYQGGRSRAWLKIKATAGRNADPIGIVGALIRSAAMWFMLRGVLRQARNYEATAEPRRPQ
jgi:hypothetical protein